MAYARFNLVSIASLLLVSLAILIFYRNGKTGQLRTRTSNLYEKFVARSQIIVTTTPFDYKAAMAALNEARVDQEDPRLIQLIRDYYIDHPSDKEYNLTDPSVLDTSQGQSKYVDKRLNSKEFDGIWVPSVIVNLKTGGFFVECGAHDGVFLSNSMFFERARNWEGILIEANPQRYNLLKMKNRKAYSINACLSIYPYPAMVTFIQGAFGRIQGEGERQDNKDRRTRIQAQCFPLTSILLALGRTTVDYFSLDIEGAELKVLKTIPMKSIDIKIMSVEVTDYTQASRDLTAYLADVGFQRLTHMTSYSMRDTIFENVNINITSMKSRTAN